MLASIRRPLGTAELELFPQVGIVGTKPVSQQLAQLLVLSNCRRSTISSSTGRRDRSSLLLPETAAHNHARCDCRTLDHLGLATSLLLTITLPPPGHTEEQAERYMAVHVQA